MPDSLLLAEKDSEGGSPPTTDPFFTRRAIRRNSVFDIIRLGLAVGLGFAVLFVIVSIISVIGSAGTVLSLFNLLFPGFGSITPVAGILLGLAWTFVYGFIFGLVIGLVYNHLLRVLLEDESYEVRG